MLLAGIDTGTIKSAYTVLDTDTMKIVDCKFIENDELHEYLWNARIDMLIIEMLEPQGSSIGEETYAACYWTGRFWTCAQFAGAEVHGITRSKSKKTTTGTASSNDAKVTAALALLFDPQAKYGRIAKGTKKNPGPCYGFTSHNYQALSLCIAYLNGKKKWDDNGHPTIDSVIWDARFSLTAEKRKRYDARKKKSRTKRHKKLWVDQNSNKMKPPRGM